MAAIFRSMVPIRILLRRNCWNSATRALAPVVASPPPDPLPPEPLPDPDREPATDPPAAPLQGRMVGPLVCIDFNTGKQKWEYPGVGTGGIIAAGNKLLAMTEKGKLLIAPASPDAFKPTAQAQILTGKTWAPPILANGRLYVRNAQGDCVCVDLRKK